MRECAGAVAVTIALSFSAIAGFAGLATEVGGWYATKRAMQGAADAAAYTAGIAKIDGATTNAYTAAAKSIASTYNFVDGAGSVTVAVNNPPATGNHTSANQAVEVVISQTQSLALAGLFLRSPPTIQARAVAAPASGTGCVLALEKGNVTDISENGNTVVNLNGCSLYVNSSSNSALTLSGQAQINAWSANISGNYQTSGQASLNTTHGTNLHTTPINDPYANVPVPTPSGPNRGSINQSGTYSPGTYSDISLSGGKTATLTPGVYILNGGGISLSGNSTLSGDGVTIVLTSTTSQYGTVSISGGSTVNLTAPTVGDTAGIAIFQDRNAPQTGSDSFSGGTTQNITGAIYFPNQPVTFSGGTTTGGARCTQLIAYRITFNGNANLNSDCIGTGVRGAGTGLLQLVE